MLLVLSDLHPDCFLLTQGLVQNFVRSTLSLTFVIAAARVVFNIKARMTRETTWSLELKGELTKQRRVEAVDKLLTVLTLLVASVFGLQAIGLDGECTFSKRLFHQKVEIMKKMAIFTLLTRSVSLPSQISPISQSQL